MVNALKVVAMTVTVVGLAATGVSTSPLPPGNPARVARGPAATGRVEQSILPVASRRVLRGRTAAGSGVMQQARPEPLDAEQAMVNRYCVTCHNARRQTPAGAPLLLDQLPLAGLAEQTAVWEKVVRKLRSGAMPPAGMPRPEAVELAGWLTKVEGALDRAAAGRVNPGRPAAVHRLNRAEYVNAIRDVLGLEVDGRALLPPDDAGYGFDNIGDVLSVSPGLMERYMLAAAKVSRQALGDPSLRPTTVTYKNSPYLMQNDRMSEDLPFGSRGGLAVRHHFPLDGEYTMKLGLEGSSDQQVEIRIDRARVKLFAQGGGREPKEARVQAKAGTRLVSASFVGALDTSLPIDGRPASVPITSFEFSQSAIESMQIVGPELGMTPGTTASREKVLVCSPATREAERECARAILSRLARRAYRQPVSEADVAGLLGVYDAGRKTGDFETGVRWGLEAVLVSPRFLFRVEREPAGAVAGRAYAVSEMELASRLAFFLWSSVPDEELLGLAERGRLRGPGVLAGQVRRMLADDRARALVTNFGGQWLYLRNLRVQTPNATLFPEFDDNLREAMQRETELFLEDQIRRNRSVSELLTANYTFVNQRLAAHYGLTGVYGSHFRRVEYADDRRAGLLGQGSILTVTSEANRTSPVKRGKWLLENLLGAPPPPPPPNVPALPENGEGRLATSVRARTEEHRRNPVCASCHAQMDPLGFALENFDAVGRWREEDEEARTGIDASGTLGDGSTFAGPAEFRVLLIKRRGEFETTVVEKLLTYALGRGLEYSDAPVVRAVRRRAGPEVRWASLVTAIVESPPFQMRLAGPRAE